MSCRTQGGCIALVCSTLLCFAGAGKAAGQTPGPTPSTPSTAADFGALVKKGDQARIAGKWLDALHAYAGALELRDDPLVAGRLGLVLLEFREYDVAATQLLRAIERGAGFNDAERSRFFQAFLVAQKETCRLDVIIVQTGVRFEIDGEPTLDGRHDSWTFVKAGKHSLHASLEGFEDQTIVIYAPRGGKLSVNIDLHPVKPKGEPAKQPDPEPPPNAMDPPLQRAKPIAVAVEDKPAAPTNPLRRNGSVVFGLGLGFVFEATPTPAMGPHAFVAWRSRSWWEVGVDARVAWTFVKDEVFPTTKFVTWSVMVAPCGRWWKQRLLTCGLVQLDGAQRTDGSEGILLPGFGLRGGVEFGTHARLHFQLIGDVVVHRQGFAFRFPETITSWSGSFSTGTLALRAVIKP